MKTVIVPHACAIFFGKCLLLIVLVAVSGNSPAALNHEFVDIGFAKIHGSDQAMIFVGVSYHSADFLAANELDQPVLYDSAVIDGSTVDYRGLAMLGRVNTCKSDFLAVHIDAVGIGNSGATDYLEGEVGSGSCRRRTCVLSR